MDKHTLAVLEFDSLLELLAQRALSEPGRNHCKGLRPDLSSDQAGRMWKILDEARDVFELRGGPPLSDLPDPGPIISELGPEGAYLDSESLLLVNQVVTASRRVREFLQTDQEETSLLFEIAAELPVLRDIERSINRSIGPHGEILDNASPKLARIRKDTAGLRSDIQTRLGTLMKSEQVKNAIMDDIITQRNGRYVIPVRASSVSQVPGLVHDHSASGASSYVEPLAVLDENNRLNKLKSEEKREILRILIELSRMVADNGNEICQAGELLAEIDFTFAAARLSRDQNGSTPELNQSGGLEFRSARHPLLLPQAGSGTVVPVDINLEPDNRIMVISGINTGGKTVALKTAGLLCLMAQAGLHIPVGKGSSLRFFENILADIGDEQDIASNLSTFSGHIKRLGAILEEAGPETLVLLDELGTGTDLPGCIRSAACL